ncbi:MAG: hypothetical protein Q7S92_02765, partial [Candidatus Diapherotrites archaeon]|nr:hypothetical protein [Candidatus Diapherotrites archaeon]
HNRTFPFNKPIMDNIFMAIAREGLILSVLGFLILAAVFVFVFQGIIHPVQAMLSMLNFLLWGAVIGFSLLFILVGFMIAFS